jgi:F420 biosynthesis protein FbiB-like protein
MSRDIPFLDVLRSRRSIRNFSDRPVSAETLRVVIEAATWAPSAHGDQPWRFVVLADPTRRMRLARAMGARRRATGRRAGEDPEVLASRVERSISRIGSAPAAILVCGSMAGLEAEPSRTRRRAEHLMVFQGVAAAVQNLLLAAYAMGLGACWICAPLFCSETVRRILELDPDWEPHAMVVLGYPLEEPAARPAGSVEAVTAWR